MTEFMPLIAIAAVAVVALGAFIAVTRIVKPIVTALGDAQRLLASRDYTDFAHARVVERSGEGKKEPTQAELEAAAERELYERAAADPFSTL